MITIVFPLKLRQKGPDVGNLQDALQLLIEHGLLLEADEPGRAELSALLKRERPDETFGPGTRRAVVALQQERRLDANGGVDARTAEAIMRLLAAIDGSCESGVESIVRLALRRRRVRMRPQVTIPGVGRVDLVVGDRLVIECDGFEWHGTRRAFEEDRRRDLALAARGYHPVRLTYSRVLNAWPDVERELLMLVRRGEHRWASRHVALGHARRVHDVDCDARSSRDGA